MDRVEIDVQVTADAVAVVVHDTVLTGALYRLGGRWLPEPGLSVGSATQAELRVLEAGAVRPGGPVALALPEQRPLARTRIPRLSEVLSLLALYAVPILLEIKPDATDAVAFSAAYCVESFDGRMRDELLNETMCHNLAHARAVISAWAADYNTERPHSALDYHTPAACARTLTTAIARPAKRDESSPRHAVAQPAPTGVNINRA